MVGDRVGVPWLGLHVRPVRVLRERPREPLSRRTLHRLSQRRRLCRLHRRRCRLHASSCPTATATSTRRRCCAPASSATARIAWPGTGGGPPARAVRLRRGSAHHRAGRAARGTRSVRVHIAGRRRGAGVRTKRGRHLGRRVGRAAARAARRGDHFRAGRPTHSGSAVARRARRRRRLRRHPHERRAVVSVSSALAGARRPLRGEPDAPGRARLPGARREDCRSRRTRSTTIWPMRTAR